MPPLLKCPSSFSRPPATWTVARAPVDVRQLFELDRITQRRCRCRVGLTNSPRPAAIIGAAQCPIDTSRCARVCGAVRPLDGHPVDR